MKSERVNHGDGTWGRTWVVWTVTASWVTDVQNVAIFPLELTKMSSRPETVFRIPVVDSMEGVVRVCGDDAVGTKHRRDETVVTSVDVLALLLLDVAMARFAGKVEVGPGFAF